MPVIKLKRNWIVNMLNKKYIPDVFRLFIEIPFVTIHIELLTRSYEMAMFNYLVFRIKVHKYENLFELKLSDRKRYNG